MPDEAAPEYLSISPLVYRGISWDIFKDTQLYLRRQPDKMLPVQLTHAAAYMLLFERTDDPGLTTQADVDDAATQLFVTRDVYDRLQQKIQQGDKPSETVAVEVVPLDVAVAIAYEAAYAIQHGGVIGLGFREFIADQLRQRAAIHTQYVALTHPLPGDKCADHYEEAPDVHGTR